MSYSELSEVLLASAAGAGGGVLSLAALRIVVRQYTSGATSAAVALHALRSLALAALLLAAVQRGAAPLLGATVGLRLAGLVVLHRATAKPC